MTTTNHLDTARAQFRALFADVAKSSLSAGAKFSAAAAPLVESAVELLATIGQQKLAGLDTRSLEASLASRYANISSAGEQVAAIELEKTAAVALRVVSVVASAFVGQFAGIAAATVARIADGLETSEAAG